MNKILIIGAGFAGLSAANRLSQSGLKLDITLIDKRETADFLPLLPDCIGRGINPEFLTLKIEEAGRILGFQFIKGELTAVDLEKRKAVTRLESLSYDFLIIASGSETNFYGNDNIRESALTLDDTDDVRKIIGLLKERISGTFIIGGGGYTGIEVATNLRVYLNKMKLQNRILIVERAPKILGPLPEWMREYVADNLKRLKIEVLVNSGIEKIEGKRLYLTQGMVFQDALVIWAAGVKTSGFIQDLKAEKNPQGRIKVDAYLRLNENCFVAGDAALFSFDNSFLRMAVQFAITQGECAAENLIASIRGRRLNKYRPHDLGYVIPMANNRSCGQVLGIKLKGTLPTLLHFMMCAYRLRGVRNKFGVLKNLIAKRRA
jgi:NADH dehydrogenase FAD-containing subunit